MTNTDVFHIVNTRKHENIEFTFIKKNHKRHHVFIFMDLENLLKLRVSQIFSDCQLCSDLSTELQFLTRTLNLFHTRTNVKDKFIFTHQFVLIYKTQ